MRISNNHIHNNLTYCFKRQCVGCVHRVSSLFSDVRLLIALYFILFFRINISTFQ
jgi:hypothetical protein